MVLHETLEPPPPSPPPTAQVFPSLWGLLLGLDPRASHRLEFLALGRNSLLFRDYTPWLLGISWLESRI